MREVTGWPTSTDVTEPVLRVSHGGKDREVRSLSLTRTLPSSVHAQAVGMGGIPQATGQVTWAALEDVVTAQPTAFNRLDGWPPKTRDPVSVWLGYRTASGDALAKVLTGFIKSSQGDPAADVSSSLVDRVDRLNRKVDLPPLLRAMPPLADGGPWRGVELYPTFFTDLAARAGGFYSTPPLASGAVVSAPLMGSAWPERGVLSAGVRSTNASQADYDWAQTPWGIAVGDASIVYTPAGSSVLNRAMEITAMAPPAPRAGGAYVAAVWGAVEIRMVFNASTVSAVLVSGGSTTVCTLAAAGTVLTLRVVLAGGSLAMTLRDASGAEASGSVALAASGASMTAVKVASPSAAALVGGVQVAFPSTAFATVSYTRSAFLTPAAHHASLAASPPIMGATAKSLLEEQSKAELAAWWIDGDGNLHWRNRNVLVSGAPIMELTSMDHLKSLQWEEDFAGVASTVEVMGREATVLQFKYPKVDLWSGSYGKVLANGSEKFEELIHPGADTDWIMVDTLANNPAGFDDYNAAIGSWAAVYFYFTKGTSGEAGYGTAEGVNLTWAGASIGFVDHKTYKVATTVYSVGTAGWDKAEFDLKVPPQYKGSGASWRQGGESYPIIRAFGKTDWADRRYTSTAAGGMDAPVLSHDVGWWVQEPAAVQAIADLLASQTSVPRPFLTGVSLVPDSRLELGDIVTLSDPDLTGIRFTALVVGLDQSLSASPISWSMAADFRILDLAVMTPTLSDLDRAWAAQILSALDTARAGETLAAMDAAPLKGAPQ